MSAGTHRASPVSHPTLQASGGWTAWATILSHHTGGLFLTTFHHPRRAIERVASAVGGRYVLFTLAPDLEPGSHSIDVELRRGDGRALARSTYVHQ